MNKVAVYADQCSEVIRDWLEAEVATSFVGNNSVLDGTTDERLKALQLSMRLPYGSDNFNSAKHESHTGRLPNFFSAREMGDLTPQELEVADARLIFAPLMSVSGAYRTECMLTSTTAKEYLARRLGGTSIDLTETIADRIEFIAPKGEISAAEIGIGALKRRFDYVYSQGGEHIREIIARAKVVRSDNGAEEWEITGIDEIGDENSQSVVSMQKAQRGYIQLATDCILMAAKTREGAISEVPFLEPRSITEQSGQIHYPLRQPIDWLPLVFKSTMI